MQADKVIANCFTLAELSTIGVASPLKEYAVLLEKEVSGLYLDAHAKIDRGNVICTAGYIRHRAALYEEQLEATIARLMSQSTDSSNPGDTTGTVVEVNNV